MSTAQEAWEAALTAWQATWKDHPGRGPAPSAAFLAGYRAGQVAALEDFAADPCDRNKVVGFTEQARHFGTIYGNLARARAAEVGRE